MKKPVLILLVIMLILTTSVFVRAQTETKELEEKAGITPDNPILWSLERFAEQARLLFTFDDVKKAELRLQFAEERIAEIEVMIQKGTLGAERLAEMIKIHGVQEVVNLSQEFWDNETNIKFREMVQKHVALLQDVIKFLPEEKSIELQDFINNSLNFTIPVEPKKEKEANWSYCEKDSDCVTAGCSGQLCVSKEYKDIVTTCVSLPVESNIVCKCINTICIWQRIEEKPRYECISDSDCTDDKICVNHSCKTLNCGIGFCGYIKEHKCYFYECCEDGDCGARQSCQEHKCKYKCVNVSILEGSSKKIEIDRNYTINLGGVGIGDVPVSVDNSEWKSIGEGNNSVMKGVRVYVNYIYHCAKEIWCTYADLRVCYEEGYEECKEDSECTKTEICENRVCRVLNCKACQYIENHRCVDYECCENKDCDTGQECTGKKCINKTVGDTIPPTITITNPQNGANVTTTSVWFNVTTNENAVCQYAERGSAIGGGGGGGSGLRNMSETGGIVHSAMCKS